MNNRSLPPVEPPLPATSSSRSAVSASNVTPFTPRAPRPALERSLRARSRALDRFDGILICHQDPRWGDDEKPLPRPRPV